MASSLSELRFCALRADCVELLDDGMTAVRRGKDAARAMVFSSAPLQNDRTFQIRIDKTTTTNGTYGSVEIGVITCEPSAAEMTGSSATIVNGSWVHAADFISRNATPCIHLPNKNLNSLDEGDTCGVMRTSKGDLIFEFNGECLGIIAQNVPPRIYAVVDLFGKCIQVSLDPSVLKQECSQHRSDKTGRSCPALTPNVPYFSNLQLCPDLNVCLSLPLVKANGQYAISQEHFIKNNKSKLRFHQHCGNLVKLSTDRKSAERRDPLDEFNNGVVMTHRTLNDDELFEIRIDRLVNKWSGSLEVGVTIHNPLLIEFPTTMTNMHSGTIMMSGCGILINGQGTRREYGQYNLDKLKEGDRVGMMRKINGNLHYFINGLDQGVAASKIPQQVWGVIDLYGMTVKVTVIDPEERKLPSFFLTRKLSQSSNQNNAYGDSSRRCNAADASTSDRLLFHSNCGTHAVVSDGGLTAFRPRANDDFNNGVVLTNRSLRPDEVFEVRLDKVVKKWAGSIEIGVTTHAPDELDFPITMTNMRSGTWMMTGNGVMHNGTTVQDRYGSSLDRIIVGDRVGVVRQSCGTLRFYINGVDQGPAITGVPENVYGVVDLYGQAAQASIIQFLNSPESLPSCVSNATLHGGDLCFHRVHGHNVRVQGVGLVATRIASMVNFEDALVFSSRPLRECEMFQVRVCEILPLWDTCVAFGVTSANPAEMAPPSTFKGIAQDTYMLHGRSLIHNGCYVTDKYPLNLFNLSSNSRIGVMRHADRSVHFYLDGMDQGKAWDVYDLNVYAVVDLSGQCSEICVSPPKSRGFSGNSDNSLNMATAGLQCSHVTKHIFSEYCGSNIEINGDYTVARVVSSTTVSNLVFSASLLHPDGLFEIEVVNCDNSFAGSMRIGVTDVNILNAYVNSKLPSSILDLPPGTMFVEGNRQITVGESIANAVYPSLRWLKTKDRIGLRRIAHSDCISLQLNAEEIGVVFRNVPDKVFVVLELCGPQTAIRAVSAETFACDDGEMEASDDGNSLRLVGCVSPVNTDGTNESEHISRVQSPVDKKLASFFHINHGGNVVVEKQGLGVKRLTGYNRAIVVASKPISKGQSFKFRVSKVNGSWSSSLMVGASKTALALRLPTSAADLKQGCWIVSGDRLYLDGNVMWSDFGKALESVSDNSVITLDFTENRELYLTIDDYNLGCFARVTQRVNKLYPIVDIYGQCEQISIVNDDYRPEFTGDCPTSDGEESEILSDARALRDEVNDDDDDNNSSSYYKKIQLCEKAYLEYYEKEFSALIEFGENTDGQIASSSTSNRPKTTLDSKRGLSKSLSENESFNLALRNISMTASANATNELRNREIKRRTTIVDCFQTTNDRRTFDIWYSAPIDDLSEKKVALHRSATLQDIKNRSRTVRRSESLDDLTLQIPALLNRLFAVDDSSVKSCNLREIQTKRDLDNLNHSENISENVGDFISKEESDRSAKDENASTAECTISLLTLGAGSRKSRSSVGEEHRPNSIIIYRSSRRLPCDDYIYYVRDLYRIATPVFDCPLLNRAIKRKQSLGLPKILFSEESPQCFCENCDLSNTDSSKGWVKFTMSKLARSPTKRPFRVFYLLMDADKLKDVLRIGAEPGIVEGEAFVLPFDVLPAPGTVSLRCFDKKHKIGNTTAALRVTAWHLPCNGERSEEPLLQMFRIRPAHYRLETMGICRVTALLFGAT